MINAKEAKRLADEAENNVVNHCEKISVAIEKAAREGAHTIKLDNVFHFEPLYKVEKKPFYSPTFTSFQQKIKDKLTSEGFVVKIVSVQHDGRGGLGCMDDEPHPYTSFHIQIGW
jgi:hypothetical protein